MKISEILRIEHMQIYRFLQLMESMCRRFQSGKTPDAEHFDIIIRIMRTFIGNNHHTKEEQYLFPSIPDFNTPSPFSAFFLINAAHSIFPGHINDITRIMQRIGNRETAAGLEIYDAAHRFSRLMMNCIRRENEFLEGLDRYLLPHRQDELLRRFEYVERSINKKGEMDRLVESIDDLEKIYINGKPLGSVNAEQPDYSG